MKTTERVTPNQIKDLRESGLINENEIAYVTGDLLLAENVLTGEKRVIGNSGMISESNKRVLKG